MIHALLLALCLAAPATDARAHAGDPPAGAPSTPQLLTHTLLIGASLTAGFGLQDELEAKADLGTFVAAGLGASGPKVTTRANTFFFESPVRTGSQLVDQALELEPSLVVALDFLFWYGYGEVLDEEDRMARLELGLAQLERLPCALLVADLPDMRPALRGSSPLLGGGPLLAPAQVPERATLERINARLRAWAAERERVRIVPLFDFLEGLRGGNAFQVAGESVSAEALPGLLQSDLLHPTAAGAALVTLLAMEGLRSLDPALADASPARESRTILEGVMERTSKEREQRRERERRREERRREREEKREKEGEGGSGAQAARFALEWVLR